MYFQLYKLVRKKDWTKQIFDFTKNLKKREWMFANVLDKPNFMSLFNRVNLPGYF